MMEKNKMAIGKTKLLSAALGIGLVITLSALTFSSDPAITQPVHVAGRTAAVAVTNIANPPAPAGSVPKHASAHHGGSFRFRC